jgi:hypothetical protein
MSVETSCPKGHRVQVLESHCGTQVSCPVCGETFVAPALHGGPPPKIPPHREPAAAQPAAVNVQAAAAPAKRLGDMLPNAAALAPLLDMTGRPMVAVGLLLVLLARGCDNLGKRAVSRAEKKASVAQAQFEDVWEAKVTDLQRQMSELREKSSPSPEDAQKITDLQKSLSDLQKAHEKARKSFEEKTLRDLKIAARDAAADNEINGYWREMFFVFASLVLSCGLLALARTAQGAERVICLVMLTIIVFSIYIIGIAWVPLPRS